VTLFSQHREGAGSAQEARARRSTLAGAAHAALVCAAACVALLAAAPLAAQPPGAPAGAPGAGNARNNNAAAAPGTAGDRTAAARNTANQLRGVGNEEALMGGPPAYSNPYPTAGDADEARQTDLMKAERVPTGGGPGFGYDPLPPGGRRRPPAADAANGGAAGADNGPARTPQAAAQAAYRDAFKGPANGNANGQTVYRMPW
jgi:hypothetical protein